MYFEGFVVGLQILHDHIFFSYGSGYDNLGQGQPSKQDFNNYSTGNGTTGKSSGAQGSSGAGGPGKGE